MRKLIDIALFMTAMLMHLPSWFQVIYLLVIAFCWAMEDRKRAH